jgi:pSer/pThr/pTyr-binding forkhead associated (FHA) protein
VQEWQLADGDVIRLGHSEAGEAVTIQTAAVTSAVKRRSRLVGLSGDEDSMESRIRHSVVVEARCLRPQSGTAENRSGT